MSASDAPPRIYAGSLHNDLCQLLRHCHLRNQQSFARAFEGTGLTLLQFAILELVLQNPGISHGAIAETLGTAPSVVTTAMKPLRNDGLVVEESAADDGRRSGYRLTPEGDARFGTVRDYQAYAEELLAGALDAEERRVLKGLLQRLLQVGRLWPHSLANDGRRQP